MCGPQQQPGKLLNHFLKLLKHIQTYDCCLLESKERQNHCLSIEIDCDSTTSQ